MMLHDLRPTRLERLDRFSAAQRERILDALAFAKERHAAQERIEGGPYYTHLVAVAQILIDEFAADADTAIAGLLHDTLEDTKTRMEEIADRFGPDVRSLVDAATEVGRGDGTQPVATREERAALTHAKVHRAAQRDTRAIAVKAADRWHNLLTCDRTYRSSQRRNAREAIEFHVPALRTYGFARQADALAQAADAVLARAR